jgi:hypothetical protein
MMLIILFWRLLILANEPIAFLNPSFEGEPQAATIPMGWTSFTPGSTPDILPGAWGLHVDPADGQTCIGLVSRKDGTSENISQNLSQPLKPGVCYTFTIKLSHLPSYVSYDQPLRLRIWGGPEDQRSQLLAASPLINHTDWRTYKFEFVPKKEVRCITLEAYFGPGYCLNTREIFCSTSAPISKAVIELRTGCEWTGFTCLLDRMHRIYRMILSEIQFHVNPVNPVISPVNPVNPVHSHPVALQGVQS